MDLRGHIEVHPAAELFPLLDGTEFEQLIRDIEEHGQRDPIVLTPDGLLLDGRNRWRACEKLGVTPITRVEAAEPWAFVVSTNLHRRHLDESQRAMVAAKLARRHPGRASANTSDDVFASPRQADAAAMLNVGHTSVQRASKVLKWGTANLQDAVDQGQITVTAAARAATQLDDQQQDDMVHLIRHGADPSRVAPPAPQTNAPGPTRPSHTRARHRHVGLTAVEQTQHALDALGLILDTADGLEPSITSEQAGHLLTGLSKSAGHIRRLSALLKTRKESTT